MFLPDKNQTPDAPAPIRPWEYVRLRREAAGLTIAQAAKAFWHHPEHREEMEAIFATYEQPGIVMSEVCDLTINRAFPFDHLVYRQLANDPANQHPRLCRTCGWDEWTEANDLLGNSTTWAEQGDTCTRCEQLREREARATQPLLPLGRAA